MERGSGRDGLRRSPQQPSADADGLFDVWRRGRGLCTGCVLRTASLYRGVACSSAVDWRVSDQRLFELSAGQQLASDPDLAPVIEDVRKNGQAAIYKHMSNPAVMAKLTKIAGPMLAQMNKS